MSYEIDDYQRPRYLNANGFEIDDHPCRYIYFDNCYSTGFRRIGHHIPEHLPKKARLRMHRDWARAGRRPALIHNGGKPR